MLTRDSLLPSTVLAIDLSTPCGSSSGDAHGTQPCTPVADAAFGSLEANEIVTPDQRLVVLAGGAAQDSRAFMGAPDHLVEGRMTLRTQVTCGDVEVSFVLDGTT